MIFNGIVQGEELDALLLGVLHLFESCRHLFLATTVSDKHALSTKAFCRTTAVHSGIAATHNHHVFRFLDGRSILWIACIHQVDARQILVAGHDSVRVLARDAHEVWQTSAGAYEDALEVLSLKVSNCDGLTHDTILHELHANLLQVLYLDIHNRVWKTEFGYAVLQYATNLVQSLEDGHVVAGFCHIACETQS